jgi:hypothetical protein
MVVDVLTYAVPESLTLLLLLLLVEDADGHAAHRIQSSRPKITLKAPAAPPS